MYTPVSALRPPCIPIESGLTTINKGAFYFSPIADFQCKDIFTCQLPTANCQLISFRPRNPIPTLIPDYFFRCSPSESESVSITNTGSGRHTGLPLQFKLPTIFLRSVFPVVDPELLYPQSHDPLGEAELCYGILFACYIRNKITMAISFFYCFWIWGRGEKEVFFIDYSDLFCLLPLIVLITEASSLFLLLVAMLVFFRFMRL